MTWLSEIYVNISVLSLVYLHNTYNKIHKKAVWFQITLLKIFATYDTTYYYHKIQKPNSQSTIDQTRSGSIDNEFTQTRQLLNWGKFCQLISRNSDDSHSYLGLQINN